MISECNFVDILIDPRKEQEPDDVFLTRICKSWRSKFPKSSVTDDDLIKKINEALVVKDEDVSEAFFQGPAAKKIKMETKVIKSEPEDPDTIRKPNSRGQMNWNKQAITDLLECHKVRIFRFLKSRSTDKLEVRGQKAIQF